MMKLKKPTNRAAVKKSPTVGARIIGGLEEAIAWGEDIPVRVSHVKVPDVDVYKGTPGRWAQSDAVRLEVRLSYRHAQELGAGTGASGYTDKGVVGCNLRNIRRVSKTS